MMPQPGQMDQLKLFPRGRLSTASTQNEVHMSRELLWMLAIRWVHILCATLAIGGPFFLRFVLLPAAGKTLDEPAHQQLRGAINARWRPIVYTLITLFILTGLFQFLVPMRVEGVLL